MPFTVQFKKSAAKDFKQLPRDIQEQIGPRITALAQDPFPHQSKKMKGNDDLWRIRIGAYRVIYKVEAGILQVLVVEVGHRSDIYRDY